jgi:hypothetical protein
MLVLMLILCDHRFYVGVVALQYVTSELQLVDFFTKAQTRAHHQFYLSKFNVVDPP